MSDLPGTATSTYTQRDPSIVIAALQPQIAQITNGQWTDFTDNDAGNTLLKTLIGQYAQNAGFIDFGVGEATLSSCKTREAAVRLAKMLGYVPARIQTATVSVQLNFNAFGNPVTIPAGDLWLINSVPFTNLTDININIGQTSVQAILTQGTPYAPNPFSSPGTPWYEVLIPANVANLAVNVNNALWTEIDDWIGATVLTSYKVYENTNGLSIIFGANINTYAPVAGASITVAGILSDGVAGNTTQTGLLVTPVSVIRDIDNNDVTNSIKGTTLTLATGGSDAESIQSIKANAPALYTTQGRLVTAADFQAFVLSLSEVTDALVIGGQDPQINRYGEVHIIVYGGSPFSVDPSFLDYVLSQVQPLCIVTVTPVVSAPVVQQLVISLTARLTEASYTLGSAVSAALSTLCASFFIQTQKIGSAFYQSRLITYLMQSATSVEALDISYTLISQATSAAGAIVIPLCDNYDVTNCKLTNAAGSIIFQGDASAYVQNGDLIYVVANMSDQLCSLAYGFTGQDVLVPYNQVVTQGSLAITISLPEV